MNYAVAITKDNDSCFGVSIPDIPSCYSAGETLNEALHNAEQAISSHLELLAEKEVFAPTATPVDDHLDNPAFAGATWALVKVDTSAYLGKTEKASVTLPKILIRRIDELVLSGSVKNRSAFLADSAVAALGKASY